ncbi:dUTP diphosphatase [Paenibacillus senegalensis]|uniref:dUTP diphosphatase n=1 Tax=Paenibacillus senegalensis TaxID=1465766 RepID=UPI000288A692|nr:dUTP diphosphatase [Paenibacillus senegalensis]
MNISELVNMQRELDARIIKDKGIEGQDLFADKVLALLTEIGEFANETRCFKYWSKDQDPRTTLKCNKCNGNGYKEWFSGSLEANNLQQETTTCEECGGIGEIKEINPLLEEYIDCFHFFLSIAIYKGWEEHLYIHEEAIEEIRGKSLDGGLTGAILETSYWILKMKMEKDKDEKIEKAFGYSKQVFCFKNAWFCFIAVGMVGFNFTWDQLCEAYMAKNQINHDRQATGY